MQIAEAPPELVALALNQLVAAVIDVVLSLVMHAFHPGPLVPLPPWGLLAAPVCKKKRTPEARESRACWTVWSFDRVPHMPKPMFDCPLCTELNVK